MPACVDNSSSWKRSTKSLRRGLPTEESTVVMFANDIIKRIDLIDALSSRYAGLQWGRCRRPAPHACGTPLKTSFCSTASASLILAMAPKWMWNLRKRITVVESVPGKNKPRVVETCRSGFIYSREEGHEFILRKVEVRTSSL